MLVELWQVGPPPHPLSPRCRSPWSSWPPLPVLVRRTHPASGRPASRYGDALRRHVLPSTSSRPCRSRRWWPATASPSNDQPTPPRSYRAGPGAARDLRDPVFLGRSSVQFRTAEIPKNLAFVAAPLLLGSAVRERRMTTAALLAQGRGCRAHPRRGGPASRRRGAAPDRPRRARRRGPRDGGDQRAGGRGAHLLTATPSRRARRSSDIEKVSSEALPTCGRRSGCSARPGGVAAPIGPDAGTGELDEGREPAHRRDRGGLDIDRATATCLRRSPHRLPDRAGGADQRGPPRGRGARARPGDARVTRGRRDRGRRRRRRVGAGAGRRRARRPGDARACRRRAGRWRPAPGRPAAGGSWRRCRGDRRAAP